MGCPGQNHEAALVPEFGAWDVTDPKSGEGYTAIFSEIRKEKEIASGRMPSKTPSINNCSSIQNQCGRPSSILSKSRKGEEEQPIMAAIGDCNSQRLIPLIFHKENDEW
ncbi:hypothetical protein JHK84_046158 [Glycine max]|nr:hypothetical protein JHK84_046158 [Glycine max]